MTLFCRHIFDNSLHSGLTAVTNTLCFSWVLHSKSQPVSCQLNTLSVNQEGRKYPICISSEAVINMIKLHCSTQMNVVPQNRAGRPIKMSTGMADSATNNKNYYIITEKCINQKALTILKTLSDNEDV